MNPPHRHCWFCSATIQRLWKIQRHNRKTLEGEYCSKACCINDIWGPRFWRAQPRYCSTLRHD